MDKIFDSINAGRAWYSPVGKPYDWMKTKVGTIFAGKAGETFLGEIYWDNTTIEAQVVLDEVLCLARPKYRLDSCVTVVGAPELRLKVDSGTVIAAQEKVKPLEESLIDTIGFDRTSFDLWKNVAHVVIEDESQRSSSHDVLRLNIGDAAGALAKARNDQIATELETATATGAAGSAWDVMTTPPNSDANPFTDLCPRIKAIEDAGYTPNFMAVDPGTWCDFITNTYVRDLVQAGVMKVANGGQGGQFTLPGYPDIQVVVDSAITDTVAVIGDKRATILAEGPTEAARYRHEPKGYTGYIVRQWLQPEIVCTSGIAKLTGVNT